MQNPVFADIEDEDVEFYDVMLFIRIRMLLQVRVTIWETRLHFQLLLHILNQCQKHKVDLVQNKKDLTNNKDKFKWDQAIIELKQT